MTADPRRFLYRERSTPTTRSGSPRATSPACDDGELYLQYRASEAFGFDDGRLKTADYHTASGFGLRGVTGETTAFAHANEISAAAIDRAAATLKLLDPAKGAAGAAAAAHQPGDVRRRRSAVGRSRSPTRSRCASRSTPPPAPATRASRRSASSLAGSWSVIDIVRADGFVASDVRPLVRLNVSDRRQAGRPPRDRLSRARRPLSLRPAVRAGASGTARSTSRSPRRWSISNRSPRRPARCRSCSAPAGPACCCTKRSATASKATSTARARRPSPAGSASGSPRPA